MKRWNVKAIGTIVMVGTIVTGVAALVTIIAAGYVEKREELCAHQLKELGLAFRQYANEAPGGVFPPLQQDPMGLAPVAWTIHPKYIKDARTWICPSEPMSKTLPGPEDMTEKEVHECVAHSSYWYLGYAVMDEEMGIALCEILEAAARSDRPVPIEGRIEMPSLDLVLHRFREGVESSFYTDICSPARNADAHSELPLMIEHPGIHRGGAHVLFMDGHVEFMEYPGKFPMTKKLIGALEKIDDLCRRGDR